MLGKNTVLMVQTDLYTSSFGNREDWRRKKKNDKISKEPNSKGSEGLTRAPSILNKLDIVLTCPPIFSSRPLLQWRAPAQKSR